MAPPRNPFRAQIGCLMDDVLGGPGFKLVVKPLCEARKGIGALAPDHGEAERVLLAPETERPPRGGLSEIRFRYFDQAAATAAAFLCFLRRANKPNTPSPPAKSGRAAGRGADPSPPLLIILD